MKAQESSEAYLPIDLTKLDWMLKKGFDPADLNHSGFSQYGKWEKNTKFPIFLDSFFHLPFSVNQINEFTLKTQFSIKQDRIDKGKELAFLFSGIGESWEVYLNGERIRNEYAVKDGKIQKYKMIRNAVIPIPYGLLKSENTLVIHLAGYASISGFAPNTLLGLRFLNGYILDYEKKIQEATEQFSLLLLNGIYIFFGLYHLFFFIRWTEKKYNLYFAFFSLSISTYFLAYSNFAFGLVDDTRILMVLGYSAQPLAVMSFILFLYDYFFPDRPFSLFIKYVFISNLCILVILQILGIQFYLTILYTWYILVLPQILYIFYFIINAIRLGLKDAIPMASSITIILSTVIWEMLDTIIFQTGIKIIHYTYFAFIVSLIIILANRFIEINWETGRLNIELTKQRDSFSKFVPVQFLDLMGKTSAGEISLGECILKEMTILFADIREFTSLSETMTPEQNFRFINSYLKRMSPVIEKNNGFIDKFIGDAIMAIFPSADEALQASIEMIEELKEFNEGRVRAGYRSLRIGIGLNSGKLMLGTIGHEDRLNTTVIGDTVNLAARVESLTKEYDSTIFLSENTWDHLEHKDKFNLRQIDSVIVKGKSIKVKIFECIDIEEEEEKNVKMQYNVKLKEALDFKEQGNETMAMSIFQNLFSLNPKDSIINYHFKKKGFL